MNLFRFFDLLTVGGLLCGGSLLLGLLLAFLYAAVRERGGRILKLLLLLLVAGALGGCGTLRMEVVAPTPPAAGQATPAAFRTATPGVTAGREDVKAGTETATARPTVESTATATPSAPDFSGVYFCLEPCEADGSNARSTFPAGVETIYTRWRYAGVPEGAAYERVWRNRGEAWVSYQCTWPGPRQGIETITLTEPDGLRSGPWELTIRVEGEVVLSETFTLTGEHEYWQPAGTFNSCYGKLSQAPTATFSPTPPRPRPTWTPRPTATASPTPTPTPTPVPVAIDRFEVTGVETLGEGRRITFAWNASGREATIRGETAVSLNPSWTVPLSGTIAVEVAQSVYRNPDFTLEVAGGALLTPTVATETVEVEWAACQYDYFFEPAPDLCPERAAVQTRIAYQPFEHGHMVWRENLDDIFVFYEDGTWQRFANLWPEQGEEEIEEPPEGLFRPVRGFALVWSNPEWGVREQLGWGLAPEGESSLTYQEQIPLSERLLPTYWQRAGAGLLRLTSHGGLSGNWEAVTRRLPSAREIAP